MDWPGRKPGLRVMKSATNRLSHETVCLVLVWLCL
jgi:hypothetical protein